MLNNFIEINNCKHYFANELCAKNLLYLNNPFGVVLDKSIVHPLGYVYKVKNVIDSPVRFVVQPNNSILFFNTFDWFNDENPYNVKAMDWVELAIHKFKNYLFGKPEQKRKISYILISNWTQ
jgi:hypothetical protein